MNKIISSSVLSISLLITFSILLLSISLTFNQGYAILQDNLDEQINKSSIQYLSFYNLSKSTIQDKTNTVQLLSNYVESWIQNAKSILLISSQDQSVRDNSSANLISEEFMGIPENADLPKREMAKKILELGQDFFSSIYFTTPQADIYLGEPFSQQKQLQRLNYADREWYKGIINLVKNNIEHNNVTVTDIYTSGIFISASTHTPAIAIATPVYKKYDYSNNNDNHEPIIIGYWVGILNLDDLIKNVKNLNLADNERLVIFDQNGTIVTDSKNNYYENTTKLQYFEYVDKVSTVLNGEKGVVEIKNNNDNLPTILMYYPINSGSYYWGVVYMIN